MNACKKKKSLAGTAIAAGLFSIMVANSAGAAEGWATDTLRYVYPLSTGNFVIALNSNPAICPAVGDPKYFYVVAGENGVTVDGVKAMLASALAAMAMGKQIQIAFDNSTTNCYVNRFVVVN
jgi:hypothetical protein